MALTNTKTIGLAEQFIRFLQDNKNLIQTSGLDVTNWITQDGDLKEDAVIQLAKQDEMDTAKKVQTKVANTSVKTLYNSLSTHIDAVSGVLGKNTPAAKQLKSLRSSLIKQSKKKNSGETS